MKFKNGIRERGIIVESGSNVFLPFALVFGLYVILFGTVSPGGGFQGGVIAASGIFLLYLAKETNAVRIDLLHVSEPIGAVIYVALGMLGIFMGGNFAYNAIFNNGSIGDLISAGTITFMGYAVGYKVLAGVASLLILMILLLSPENDNAYTFEEEEEE